MARRNQPTEAPEAPEPLRECVLPFSFDDPETGQPTTIPSGTKLRPDHVAVRVAAQYFVGVDTPHDERPTLVDFVTIPGTQSEHHPVPSGDRSRTGGLRLTP